MNTIHGLFEVQVEKRPNHIAAMFAGQSLTYAELNKKANQLAHYLRTMGVKPDTQVAISMDKSIDLLITMLAILKAGGAYVPLDASHPEERLLFTLNDSNTPILITKLNSKDKFIRYQGPIIVLDNDVKEINKQATHNPDSIATPQNLAYVIYTSGSSGKPKGVLIEHRSVVNYSAWFANYCHCKPDHRIDFSSNYVFDMCVSITIVPLMLGLTVVVCSDEEKSNLRHYLEYLEYNQVNIIKMTPSYFKLLVHEIKNNLINQHTRASRKDSTAEFRFKLSHLQNIILGGENLPSVDCINWLNLYPKHILFNEYGPTEATVAVSQFKISNKSCSSLGVNVPIGTPGTNMDCYILTHDNHPVPNGEAGELYIGGGCLARGYLNQPELTRKQFIPDPFSKDSTARLYKTGDLCRQLPDGTIEYLGRIDEQVKIRGFRIELGEIEQHLASHPAISEAVVLVREEHSNEKRLVAYFILKEKSTLHHQSNTSIFRSTFT